jgi:hypothetical protein
VHAITVEGDEGSDAAVSIHDVLTPAGGGRVVVDGDLLVVPAAQQGAFCSRGAFLAEKIGEELGARGWRTDSGREGESDYAGCMVDGKVRDK